MRFPVLAWTRKGAAVIGKMGGVSDLWITLEDWVMNHPRLITQPVFHIIKDVLEMRALKERCLYL